MAEGANAVLARKWFREVWLPGGEATVHELMHPDAVGHMEGAEVHGAAEFLPARAALLDALADSSGSHSLNFVNVSRLNPLR